MGKNKLSKFADLETFSCVLQYPYARLEAEGFPYKGSWRTKYFASPSSPLVVELGCGRGEYTVALAASNPGSLYVGFDRKGARLWAGAGVAHRTEMPNAAFVRTDINLLDRFFSEGEVSEIWITFPDPQMSKTRARLVSSFAFRLYRRILAKEGIIHLKTDSPFLYQYTQDLLAVNEICPRLATEDLYGTGRNVLEQIPNTQTAYETQWLSRGMSIKYISWQLPHRETFVEPAEEPEHDDYHSFSRGVVSPPSFEEIENNRSK
ncbi:tRNA (guanosine(46)-N7)-methyltransferase TrmB [Porphyromonas endodontalis]|uniref:tRNA (guanosine(46)-N7)-methyltransferase TrmB n=1 Tax=Porphyromonas endodontalis TaxID=28124 RepID=UPI0028F0D63D|nr:tRNA (guanosine(46)-N7)-methyltransferase TrmB [Porphyromonas endodontalis]